MREILCKGKRIDNGEWVEGCLVIDHSRSNLFEYRIQPVESGVLYAHLLIQKHSAGSQDFATRTVIKFGRMTF